MSRKIIRENVMKILERHRRDCERSVKVFEQQLIDAPEKGYKVSSIELNLEKARKDFDAAESVTAYAMVYLA